MIYGDDDDDDAAEAFVSWGSAGIVVKPSRDNLDDGLLFLARRRSVDDSGLQRP